MVSPGIREDMGYQLAEYIQRLHHILSNKGLFSPRVLELLGIPFQQIQSEEEGQIVQVIYYIYIYILSYIIQ